MEIKPKKVCYQGLFLDNISMNKLSAFIRNGGEVILQNKIRNPHITFELGPVELFSEEVRKNKYDVRVVGYANNGMNQGFAVEILKELEALYKGNPIKHITFALSPGARALHTGGLDFKRIPAIRVTGRLGFCMNKTNEVVY